MSAYIGAAYYPELWPLSEVDRDIERCREHGINLLRIGEFAWSSMEPEEGRFELDWLQTVLDKLHAAGISVVLCTPTCTPPHWMFKKYPETIMTGEASGKPIGVTSRCHTCRTSPKAREMNGKIVTALAERFGRHPAVVGWQIDNELFPNDCRCELCKAAFREGLKEKYGDIRTLNKRWGMYRWSLDYSSFDEIEPPVSGAWVHPSLRAAWIRFRTEKVKSFSDEQAEIIHKYSDAPAGTDMMPNNTLPYYAMNEKLDVVQYNHYDRAEGLPDTAFFYDFVRPIKDRPFWVTETQVGWNGSTSAGNGYRPEGNCYINSLLPFAYGAEANCYWLFRAHPNGHELAHGAVVSACGKPYKMSGEIKAASEALKLCADFFEETRVRADIALHYSSLAEVNFGCAPILAKDDGSPFDYKRALSSCYHAAFSHHNIDVIDTAHPLEGYKTVISPFVSHIDDETKRRICDFVNNGGTWIAGPMTDVMTGDISRYTDSVTSFLEDLAGAEIRYQIPVENDVFRANWADRSPAKISVCYDALVPVDSETLIAYDGGDFNGFAAVTRRRVGRGEVILCGTVLSHRDLLRLVGIGPAARASDNVHVVERSGRERSGLVAAELEDRPGLIYLPGRFRELISGKEAEGMFRLEPYGFHVFEKL